MAWSSGRSWQPLNVFGAFAPRAVPNGVPDGATSVPDSGALHYRRQLGDGIQLSLLGAVLKDEQDQRKYSVLNQLNFIYSLANESDLLLSLAVGSGKGLAATGQPRSEFGHLPPTLTLRWRYFF